MQLTVTAVGDVNLSSHSNFADLVGASQGSRWTSLVGTEGDREALGRWLQRWRTAVSHETGHAYRTDRHLG
jgi:hypothetical protein